MSHLSGAHHHDGDGSPSLLLAAALAVILMSAAASVIAHLLIIIAIAIAAAVVLTAGSMIALLVRESRQDRRRAPFSGALVRQVPPAGRPRLPEPGTPAIEQHLHVHLPEGMTGADLAELLAEHRRREQ